MGLVGQAYPVEQPKRQLVHLGAGAAQGGDRRLGDVVEDRQVREEVEVLEDEADVGPLAQHLPLAQLVQPIAGPAVADESAVDADQAPVRLLQLVDDAQQGRLARPGRPEDHGDLPGPDSQVDPPQHRQRPEGLVYADHLDHGRAHRADPLEPAPDRPARSRCNGVSGMVRRAPRA